MLKKRILSAMVALLGLFIILFSHKIVIGIAAFVAALICIYEFYTSLQKSGYKPIKTIGYVACLSILLIALGGNFRFFENYLDLFRSLRIFSIGAYLVVVILFLITILLPNKYNLIDISLTIFGAFYVVFLLAFVVLTRNLEGGFYFVFFIFIGAFITDTFAYFAGTLFGKKKILPEISPKKSLEGAIGGAIGCILITLGYGLLLNYYHPSIEISPLHYIILGLLCSILSQIGDWAASAVKRYVKIKDFGNIMPGHGGILDRIDSILFVAPVVYFYISFIIIQ